MIVGFLKRKFRARHTDGAGKPISRIWVGDEEEAVLVDLGSGKVHAYVSHDGYGKYYPTVFVSAFHALWISRKNHGFLVSLLSLPRFTMELLRLHSMDDAQSFAQFVLERGSDPRRIYRQQRAGRAVEMTGPSAGL